MRSHNVVNLVREGHTFITLSPESLEKLRNLRILLCGSAQSGNVDDNLIDTIVQGFSQSVRLHCHVAPNFLKMVELRREIVGEGNFPTAEKFISIADAAEKEKTDSSLGLFLTSASEARPVVHLRTVVEGKAERSIALLSGPLSAFGVHRASIQVLSIAEDTYRSGGNRAGAEAHHPHCGFGICTPDAVQSDSPESWMMVQWNTSLSLPLALMFAATTIGGQPHVEAPNESIFVQVGDVIGLELVPNKRVDSSGPQTLDLGKAAFMRGNALAQVDLHVYVNGSRILRIVNLSQFLPIGRSKKLGPDQGNLCNDLNHLHFGILLAPNAKVAVVDV